MVRRVSLTFAHSLTFHCTVSAGSPRLNQSGSNSELAEDGDVLSSGPLLFSERDEGHADYNEIVFDIPRLDFDAFDELNVPPVEKTKPRESHGKERTSRPKGLSRLHACITCTHHGSFTDKSSDHYSNAYEVHPILVPESEHDKRTRKRLVWCMLSPPSEAFLSTNRRRGWGPELREYNEPATTPSLQALTVRVKALSRAMDVFASKPDVGVTCGDVTFALHMGLFPPRMKATSEAGSRQTSPMSQSHSLSPGSTAVFWEDNTRHVDKLGAAVMFAGLRPHVSTRSELIELILLTEPRAPD